MPQAIPAANQAGKGHQALATATPIDTKGGSKGRDPNINAKGKGFQSQGKAKGGPNEFPPLYDGGYLCKGFSSRYGNEYLNSDGPAYPFTHSQYPRPLHVPWPEHC